MAEKPLTSEQILTLLEEGPGKIGAYTADLTPTQLQAAQANGGWSFNDILAHLRACSDVWGDCMAVILEQDRPTIRAINPRTWIDRTDYPELAFQPSFQTFCQQRADLLALLKPLTAEQWSRSATVTGAGKPLERTVQFYARWLATHERSHLKQIKRLTV